MSYKLLGLAIFAGSVR